MSTPAAGPDAGAPRVDANAAAGGAEARNARCLNCGAPLHGAFCHVCGQKDEPVAVPAGRFASEAFEEVFSIDRRFFRTLGLLIARPGALTAEWVAGHRVRHVPPFRLYVTLSVVYFLVLTVSREASFFFFTAGNSAESAAFIRLLPRLMFFILPAFALLLQLLFARARRFYVAHLVFALHFFAFAFLLLSAHTLLEAGVYAALARHQIAFARAGMVVDSILQLLLFVYLYLALRRAYGQGRLLTALKTAGVMIGYLGLLIATAQALLVVAGRLHGFV